jgi:hypothetical protein
VTPREAGPATPAARRRFSPCRSVHGWVIYVASHWPDHPVMRTLAQAALVLFTTSLVASTGATVPAAAGLPTVYDSGSTSAVPICGVGSSGVEHLPAAPAASVVVSGRSILNMQLLGSSIYLLGEDATIRAYDRTTGAPGVVIKLASAAYSKSFAIDATGSVYTTTVTGQLVKTAADGTVQWQRQVGTASQTLVPNVGAGPAVLSLNTLGGSSGTLYDASGNVAGTTAIAPSTDWPEVSSDGSGGSLVTDGHWVRRYSAAGTLLTTFGSPDVAEVGLPAGAPLAFYQQGGAVRMSDGTMLVADHSAGFHVESSDGTWTGTAAESLVTGLTERSAMALVGDDLYVVTGRPFGSDKSVVKISASAVKAQAVRTTNPRLGFGAGLSTGSAGNYFPAGTVPRVDATFTSDWASRSGLSLQYAAQNLSDLAAGGRPTFRSVSLTAGVVGSNAALVLPAAVPGAYQVDVRIVDSAGVQVSGTCLNYTVGAPGQNLDLPSLPDTAGYGGAGPLRDVVLAEQLGTNMTRVQIDWNMIMPDATKPLDFSALDAQLLPAAAEAKRHGVTLDVQVGQGGKERALVDNGQWGARVRELANHYLGVITTWEAWNEPNNTYGPAASYVTNVLTPFYRSIKAAEPSSTVIGGTVVGFDINYWIALLDSGGGAFMDVAAIHPYTGHNRSWEEQDAVPWLKFLRQVFTDRGHGTMPFWDTESAWWSNGDSNLVDTANDVARKIVLMRSLGIEKWAPFIPESSWGDQKWGLIFSHGPVKPAALTLMTTLSQIKGRPFLQMVNTGLPHTYLAQFGPSLGSVQPLSVAWSDDTPLDVTMSGIGRTAVGAYGQQLDLGGKVTLSGAPIFVTGPLIAGQLGTAAALTPLEGFGPNLALSEAGATATATSTLANTSVGGALDGQSTTNNNDQLQGRPAWVSAPGDDYPALTVTLPAPATIDRVLVSTTSNGSIQTGLRDYSVQVDDGSGQWRTVGAVTGQLFNRGRLVQFPALIAARVRVQVTAVNFSTNANGARPVDWPSSAADRADAGSPWYGPAVIDEVEVYAPGPSTTSGFCGIDTAHSGDTYAQWTCQR